jgi:membrane fusion protein
MSAGLFRKEALDAHRREFLGSIRLQPPSFGWPFAVFALLAIVATLGLLIGGHYTRHERVQGSLVPNSGLLSITPNSSGLVSQVLVHEGARVHAGDPLVEITAEQDSASLGNVHAMIADQLALKQKGLQSELKRQGQLDALQRKGLGSRLAMLRQQMAELEQQVALQRTRTDSAKALYRQWSSLGDGGVVSKLQLLNQHDAALQDELQLKQLTTQHIQLQQQAAELQGQLDQLPSKSLNRRSSTEQQLADVMQSMAENESHRAVLLRAPVDGIVTNLLVHSGQAVAAQQPLMSVLPAKSTLLAELWVPTKAMGFIAPGQRVVMRYDAYPYQKFGQQYGRVLSVSRSAMSADAVSRLLGKAVSNSRYRVQVSLDSESVMAYGHPEALLPGMTLDADVLLDRRRLIEWIIEPLYGFGGHLQGVPTLSGVHSDG